MTKRGGSDRKSKDQTHGAAAGPSASGGSGAADPAIPDKLYFRIGEVAELCRVETYVLRFWQTEFRELRPGKSGTGQRLYRRRDVETALKIKRLLHDEGYTIAGAKSVLASEAAVPERVRLRPELPLPSDREGERVRARMEQVRGELRELLGMLERRPAVPARPPGAASKRAPLFPERE